MIIKYKMFSKPNILLLFFLFFNFFNINIVKGHEDISILHFKHKPKVCIPDSERDIVQRGICRDKLKRHTMCDLDAFCAIERLEKLQKNVEALTAKIKNQDPINCNSLTFAHIALDSANIYQNTSGNSKVIQKVKKGQKISYVGTTDKEGWIIVVPKAKTCKIGYINESYVGLSTSSGTVKKDLPKIKNNIEITFPKWTQKGKLITLDQSGFFEIDGYINKDLGINKVIINYDGNDEEMVLGSDGSFNASLQIENTLDVRITSYKGKKQIGKVLTFKIEVE